MANEKVTIEMLVELLKRQHALVLEGGMDPEQADHIHIEIYRDGQQRLSYRKRQPLREGKIAAKALDLDPVFGWAE